MNHYPAQVDRMLFEQPRMLRQHAGQLSLFDESRLHRLEADPDSGIKLTDEEKRMAADVVLGAIRSADLVNNRKGVVL